MPPSLRASWHALPKQGSPVGQTQWLPTEVAGAAQPATGADSTVPGSSANNKAAKIGGSKRNFREVRSSDSTQPGSRWIGVLAHLAIMAMV